MTVLGTVEWYRGDSYPIEVEITNSDTDAVIDITGCSFLLTVDTLKTPPDATTKVFEVAGVLGVDPTIGLVSFTPTALDTDLSPGTYYYDLQVIDAESNIRTVVKDKWKITQDITK